MVGLLENVGISTRYIWDNLVKHPLRWLGMTVLNMIPLGGFFSAGVCMKAFRNEEPCFEGELFGPGFLVSLICFIYSLPLILVNIFLLNPVAGIDISAFVGLFDILYIIFLVIFLL